MKSWKLPVTCVATLNVVELVSASCPVVSSQLGASSLSPVHITQLSVPVGLQDFLRETVILSTTIPAPQSTLCASYKSAVDCQKASELVPAV